MSEKQKTEKCPSENLHVREDTVHAFLIVCHVLGEGRAASTLNVHETTEKHLSDHVKRGRTSAKA